MGPAALPIVGAGTSLIGANSGKNQQKAANAAANQASQNQQQLNQQLLGNINNTQNEYNQYYKGVLPELSQTMQQEGGQAQSGLQQLLPALFKAGLDPSVISQITGIDANHLNQAYTQYLSNPNATNLNQASQGAMQFYGDEAKNGINSQFANNAQNQVQQNFGQQIADATANAKPGQNINALTKDLRNQELSQSANLAGNLAGQSQTFANQAQGNLLGTAGNLDTQRNAMLGGAAQQGQGINQQAYQNLGTSTGSAQSILTAMQNFLRQGQGNIQQAYGPLQNLASGYGSQAQAAGQNAAGAGQQVGQAYGSLGNNLAQLFPLGNNQTGQAGMASQNYLPSSQINSQYSPQNGVMPGTSQQLLNSIPTASGYQPGASPFNPTFQGGGQQVPYTNTPMTPGLFKGGMTDSVPTRNMA